jgi:hypothetical protein
MPSATRLRIQASVAVFLIGLSACQTAPATSDSPEASTDVSPIAVATATLTPPPTGCVETPLTATDGLVSGNFADVVTTDLVQRSAPWIADDSKIVGEFNAPTRVYILEGPVAGNGYEWWKVTPEGSNSDRAGWVAARGKDGEEWLRPVPDAGGTWSIVSRHEATDAPPAAARAVVGADGRLYLLGGVTGTIGSRPLNNALAFEPQTCTWQDLAPMPMAQAAPHGVSAADGLLYVIGAPFEGDGTGQEPSDLQVYDPATNSWAQAQAAPGLIAWGSSVIGDANGWVWAFGSSGILAYDPDRDTWEVKPIPTPWPQSVDGAAPLDGGDVVLLGGGAFGLWRYDLNDGAWSQLGSPRVARYNALMVALPDGRLAVAGGYLAGSCIVAGDPPPQHEPAPSYDLVDVFDPESGAWQALPPLALELDSSAPIVIDGHLYVVGLEMTWDRGGSDPHLSHAEVVLARYAPPRATNGEATTASAGQGGCGG